MNRRYLDASRIKLCNTFTYPQSGVVISEVMIPKLFPELFTVDATLPTLLIPSGEVNKSPETLSRIYRFFTINNVTRDTIVHVIGGGVITDISAFAVSTFKRGVRLWLYPSTLIGMVDAAIGGKTSYNLDGFKNLIGSFYPAEQINLCPFLLKTLEPQERRQGIAEMLKIYFIDSTLDIPALNSDLIPTNEQIQMYARFKIEICNTDPYDQGVRRKLNLGHSFAHAAETLTNFNVAHGDAVIWGIRQAAFFSRNKHLITDSELAKILFVLDTYPMPNDIVNTLKGLDKEKVIHVMSQDKKNSSLRKLILFTGYREVQELGLDQTEFSQLYHQII